MMKNHKGSRHAVGDELDSLKDDVSRLRRDLAGLADALLHAGQEEAGDAKEKISKEARKRVAEVRSALSNAREMGSNALETIEEQVNERPIVSLLIAFSVGLIFGKVSHRR